MRSDRGGQPGLPGQLSATVTAVVYAVVSCDPPLVTRVTTLTCVLSVSSVYTPGICNGQHANMHLEIICAELHIQPSAVV